MKLLSSQASKAYRKYNGISCFDFGHIAKKSHYAYADISKSENNPKSETLLITTIQKWDTQCVLVTWLPSASNPLTCLNISNFKSCFMFRKTEKGEMEHVKDEEMKKLDGRQNAKKELILV